MKTRKGLFILMLAAFVLSSAILAAATVAPNVSGTWKMNTEKSKFEKGGPKGITIKFDQQGSTLKESLTLVNEGGERTVDFTYTLDGKESVQQLEGNPIKTTARWEGESLLLEFKNDDGFSFLRKVTMSGDGKSITMDVKQSTPNGTTTDMVILDKQ